MYMTFLTKSHSDMCFVLWSCITGTFWGHSASERVNADYYWMLMIWFLEESSLHCSVLRVQKRIKKEAGILLRKHCFFASLLDFWALDTELLEETCENFPHTSPPRLPACRHCSVDMVFSVTS